MTDMMNIDVSTLLNQETASSKEEIQADMSELFSGILSQQMVQTEPKEDNKNLLYDSEELTKTIEFNESQYKKKTDGFEEKALEITTEEEDYEENFVANQTSSSIELNKKSDLVSEENNIFKEEIELNNQLSVQEQQDLVTTLSSNIGIKGHFLLKKSEKITLQEIPIKEELIQVEKQNEIAEMNFDKEELTVLSNDLIIRQFINNFVENLIPIEHQPFTQLPETVSFRESISDKLSESKETTQTVQLSDILKTELPIENGIVYKTTIELEGKFIKPIKQPIFQETVAVEKAIDEAESIEELVTVKKLNVIDTPPLEFQKHLLTSEEEELPATILPTNTVRINQVHQETTLKKVPQEMYKVFEEKTVPTLISKIVNQDKQLPEFEPISFKLTMEPETLGELEVVLTKQDGKLSAEFIVKNNSIKELVQQHLSTLKENLTAQNIFVEKTSVVVSLPNPLGFDFGGDLSQRQQNQRNKFKGNQVSQSYESKEEFHEIEVAKETDSINILV